MGSVMTNDASDTDDLLSRARSGDAHALAALFARYRGRLRRMVALRLDRRLQGRLDPSDVLQEAYLDLAGRLPDYAGDPAMPFFLWLRFLTGQKLIDLSGQVLRFGIQISAPVAVSLFVVNIAFGIMAKAMPQLNVLVLSFAVSALVGLVVMFLSVPEFQGAAGEVLGRMRDWMGGAMAAMATG